MFFHALLSSILLYIRQGRTFDGFYDLKGYVDITINDVTSHKYRYSKYDHNTQRGLLSNWDESRDK